MRDFENLIEERYAAHSDKIRENTMNVMGLSELYDILERNFDRDQYRDFCDLIEHHCFLRSEEGYKQGFKDGIRFLASVTME